MFVEKLREMTTIVFFVFSKKVSYFKKVTSLGNEGKQNYY